MKRLLIGASLVAALSLGAASAVAHDRPGGVQIGTLSCHDRGGWGYLFGSSRRVRCVYSGVDGSGRYDGWISKYGVDLGYQGPSQLVWAVFAPTNRLGAGALDGHYGGFSAGASVVFGAGANAMVGGSNRTVVLQPLSVEGRTGVQVTAGVGSLTLSQVRGAYEPT